jgi:hypothetical protein
MNIIAAGSQDSLLHPLPAPGDHAGRLIGPLTGVPYLDLLEECGKQFGGQRYLEIGTQEGASLIRARGTCISIDPAYKRVWLAWNLGIIGLRSTFRRRINFHRTTSDDYFARHDPKAALGGPLQLAFIDGMHHYEFVLRDIFNCERNAAPDSVLLVHDCIPWSHRMTRRLRVLADGSFEETLGAWTGDVWKVLPILARWRPDLRITVLDAPPTGLVAITGLDPSSTILRDRHEEMVAARDAEPDTEAELAAWLAERQVIDSRAALASGSLRRALFQSGP